VVRTDRAGSRAPRNSALSDAVRAAFAYRKKIARREICPGQSATRPLTVCSKWQNFRAGRWVAVIAGDTDGLVELGEDVTRVRTGPDGRISQLCKSDLNRVCLGRCALTM